jgi:hypothetical protein
VVGGTVLALRFTMGLLKLYRQTTLGLRLGILRKSLGHGLRASTYPLQVLGLKKDEMKYYFSGSFELKYIEPEHAATVASACKYRLQSCHGSYVKTAEAWCDLALPYAADKELMLDSGAYTAWKQGKEVKLHHLMQVYGKMYEKYGSAYRKIWFINLDKIPASPGRNPVQEELDEAIAISDENFAILQKEFGDRILPVYHQGESHDRLLAVSKMAHYICLSPRNDLAEKARVEWSKEAHHVIPHNFTHGLAATGNRMMNEVPWGSVDSAYWTYTAAMGSIFVYLDGKFRVVRISDQHPERKNMGQHFDTLPAVVKEAVAQRILNYGFTIEQTQTNFVYRKAVSILEMIAFLKDFDPKPQEQLIQEQLFAL